MPLCSSALLAILRSGGVTGGNGRGFDDHVAPQVFDPGWVLELYMMDSAIDAVDDQIDPLAHRGFGVIDWNNPATKWTGDACLMMAIKVEDGRRVFAPAGSNPTAVKR
jgi:hypothetical protein